MVLIRQLKCQRCGWAIYAYCGFRTVCFTAQKFYSPQKWMSSPGRRRETKSMKWLTSLMTTRDEFTNRFELNFLDQPEDDHPTVMRSDGNEICSPRYACRVSEPIKGPPNAKLIPSQSKFPWEPTTRESISRTSEGIKLFLTDQYNQLNRVFPFKN